MTGNRNLIISYLTMRRLIGILGVALPVLVVGGGILQNGLIVQGSISSYYYSNMRDCFVGILCIVSLFLISYKGYDRIDDIVANMSGIFALGLVIFPTGMFSGRVERVGIFLVEDSISEYVHLIFGALFFLSLSFNSMFLFTRREPGFMSREKRRRNIVYRACGIIMTATIAFLTLYTIFWRGTIISKMNPVLILESIALLAFGASWLVKGNTLFKDKRVSH